ncbi:MAG: CPBP family intramembrane glutamic endopeptidase [Acidimicrobiales bacterium]
MSTGDEPARTNRALVAWFALVVIQALVNVGSVLFVDVPEDRVYRYSTAATTLLQFGVMLAVVLIIARPLGLREILALRRPASWRRAGAMGALVMAGMLVLVVGLGPLLDAGDAQKLAPKWDPDRLVPFMVNAMLIAFVGPVVEELTFRGLGFTLLRRYGPGLAIATTGVAFALSHGLLALLPTAAAFGFGLAYLRSRTDSVYPGMLVHVLFNAIGVLAIVGS